VRASSLALLVLLASSPASAQRYYRPVPEELHRGRRVRLAVQGELGGTVGPESGLGAGASFALGLQVNDIFAWFVQERVQLAGALDGSTSPRLVVTSSLLLDLTLFERIQVGAGPSVDLGIDALAPIDAPGPRGLSGPWFGIDARVAVTLAERTRSRRQGAIVALHVHPTWVSHDAAVVMILLALGYQLS
jgi:hypothetical protein